MPLSANAAAAAAAIRVTMSNFETRNGRSRGAETLWLIRSLKSYGRPARPWEAMVPSVRSDGGTARTASRASRDDQRCFGSSRSLQAQGLDANLATVIDG